jgi:peroxiredoxin
MNETNKEAQKVRPINYQSIIVIFLIIGGIGIIVLLQGKDSAIDPAGMHRIERGMPAPNFTLPDLDGKMVSLADHRGQVVLLNIWATWCAPCVAEMPSMEKLHRELKDEKFVILAVSVDESGADAVRPFMKKHRLSFPALIDNAGTLKSLYRTTGVPESFIIDKGGNIIEKVIGPRDWAAAGAIGYFRSQIGSN